MTDFTTNPGTGEGAETPVESVATAVVGAGVAGSAVALALTARSMDCAVYERVPSRRSGGLGVILMPDGLGALDRLGLGSAVRSRGVVARRAERRDPSGRLLLEKELPEHLCLFRRDLVAELQGALPAGVVRWGRELRALDAAPERPKVRLRFAGGPDVVAGTVVGADGKGSVVRTVVSPDSRLRSTGIRELINVVRAPDVNRNLAGRLVKYLSPEGGLAVGLAPTEEGWVFWYVQFDGRRHGPGEPDPGPEGLASFAEEVTRGWAEPLPELVATTDYRRSHLSDVTAMDPPERLAQGPAVLVGDAAHPLPTPLGEGANTALEDAVLLDDAIPPGAMSTDLPESFARFGEDRLPRIRSLYDAGRRSVNRFLDTTPSRTVTS